MMWFPGKEVIRLAKGKLNRSAITGRFVTATTAKSHPKTTVTESTGKGKGGRSKKGK